DFMPVRNEAVMSDLVRIVIGEAGVVDFRSDLCLRFDYGRVKPWIGTADDGSIRIVAGAHAVTFHGPPGAVVAEGSIAVGFTVRAGERIALQLIHEASHLPAPRPIDADAGLADTEVFWRDWI